MPVVLAALPEMVIALVLVLLLWAGRQLFGGLISSFASRIPLLGSVLASAAEGVIADVISVAESEASIWITNIIGYVLGPVFWFEHLIADIFNILDAVRQAIAYIVTTLIQEAVNLAVMEARVLVAQAVSQLEGLINSIYRIEQAEFAQVYATITAVEHAIEAYIQQEIAAVEAEITAAINAETQFVISEISAVESQLTQAIAAETAFVESEFKSAIAYTLAVEQSLVSDIDAETTAITAWVTGQVTSLVAAIDAVQAATVSIALTAAAAVEADLQNLKTDCTDNLCTGLGGAANIVNGLLAEGFIAALLGYAAWAATDPVGCGNDTATVLVPIATGAKDAVDSAIGAL